MTNHDGFDPRRTFDRTETPPFLPYPRIGAMCANRYEPNGSRDAKEKKNHPANKTAGQRTKVHPSQEGFIVKSDRSGASITGIIVSSKSR